MRNTIGFLAIAILLAPNALAATQDSLLTSYASFGNDELFAEYPALLFLKLTITNRLQTGPVEGTELDRLEVVRGLLDRMERLHEDLDDAGRQDVLEGLDGAALLRRDVEALTDPQVKQYREILNLTAAGITQSYVLAADRLLPQIERTAQRLALLRAAVEGAKAIQDGLAYSKLAHLEEETRQDYEADLRRAATSVDDARAQLRVAPRALSLELPRHYAALFSTRERLATAESLYSGHGEEENAAEARALGETVDARIQALRVILGVAVLGYLLVLLGVGALALHRLVRWTQNRHLAGLGDELSMEAA